MNGYTGRNTLQFVNLRQDEQVAIIAPKRGGTDFMRRRHGRETGSENH